MIYNTLHNRYLRVFMGVLGELLAAWAFKTFIAPLSLYTGGLMGVCQLIRTFAAQAGFTFGGTDIAAILYWMMNLPIFYFAFKTLGRGFLIKTIITTSAYTVFYSLIPARTALIVPDMLTNCLLGGILIGIGSGIVLTCGCSGGGLDLLGLCLNKRGAHFTVGRFSLSFNAVLYGFCLIVFEPAIAIYSVIYNFTTSLMLDRVHQQNINLQALIFTRGDEHAICDAITHRLHRGVTWWQGTGGYTDTGVKVLCTCVSRYEREDLLQTVRAVDPKAFVTIEDKVHIFGNFERHLE